MFHLDVSKVNLGVAHVAMAIHACFKCFICFRCMLQMFYLDVVKVDLVLHMLWAIHTCFKCFICFRRILQVFHLNVSKVNLGRANVAMVALAGGQWLAIAACLPAANAPPWVTTPPACAAAACM